jgi:hypothetical protein
VIRFVRIPPAAPALLDSDLRQASPSKKDAARSRWLPAQLRSSIGLLCGSVPGSRPQSVQAKQQIMRLRTLLKRHIGLVNAARRIENDKRALFRRSARHQLRPDRRRDADLWGLIDSTGYECARRRTARGAGRVAQMRASGRSLGDSAINTLEYKQVYGEQDVSHIPAGRSLGC